MPKAGFTQTHGVGSTQAWTEQVTSLATAVGLPKAGNGRRAIIQAETQPVRWAFGITPTTTVGMLLAAGDSVEIFGDLSDVQVIETAASATLNVTIFK